MVKTIEGKSLEGNGSSGDFVFLQFFINFVISSEVVGANSFKGNGCLVGRTSIGSEELILLRIVFIFSTKKV